MLSSVDRHLITAILVSLCSIGFSMLKHTSGKEKPLTTMVGFLVKCTKIEVCVFYCLCRYQQSTQRTAGKVAAVCKLGRLSSDTPKIIAVTAAAAHEQARTDSWKSAAVHKLSWLPGEMR